MADKIKIPLFLCLWGCLLPGAQAFEGPSPESYVPGELLVQFKQGSDQAGRSRVLSGGGGARSISPKHRLYHMKLTDGSSVEGSVARLALDPAVEWVQPNYLYHAHLDGTPPGEFLHAYPTPITGFAWPFVQIKALNPDLSATLPSAWGYLQSQSGSLAGPITVAVMDSGVDRDNPDFPSSMLLQGYNATSDYGGNTANSQDNFGHGTMVAGIIAAAWNNFSPAPVEACSPGSYSGSMAGVAGLPGLVKILPVKVLSGSGSGTSADLIEGINFAINNGAKVLNFSLGGSTNDTAEGNAIQDALDAGCVVVASAGNSSTAPPVNPTNRVANLSYPARFPGVIAVGATDSGGDMTYYSSAATATGSFNLMAPGGGNACGTTIGNACYDPAHNYYSTQLCPSVNTSFKLAPSDRNYGTDSGTSFSAPTVSGAVALVLALHPDWTAAEIAAQFRRTSTSIPPYPHPTPGNGTFGILNLAAALATPFATFTPGPPQSPTATRTFTPLPSATLTFTPTRTRTPTRTPTNSRTPTATRTPTDSATPSPTPSTSNTPTDSPTVTETSTPSDTATESPTSTPSNTATDSPTESPTSTPTDSPTITETSTPTETPTETPSSTPTPSPTDSPTGTLSPTLTYTSSPTKSPTPTETPLNTATATISPTPSTAVLSLPYPNPVRGPSVHWDLWVPSSLRVSFSVFTLKRPVLYRTFDLGGSSGLTWDLRDQGGSLVANGPYFVRVAYTWQGNRVEKIFKVVVEQ